MKDFKKELVRIRGIRKKMSKVKIGLPKSVEFTYSKGSVICYPKERRWVVSPNGHTPVTHIMTGRNDVTKFKARHFLKLAIVGVLRDDSKL